MRRDGGGQIGELTRRGQAAVAALARRLGLPGDRQVVLSSRGGPRPVDLAPAPVVARVATLTGWSRRDPAVWLAREVAVAGYAGGRGGPVVPPASEVDPGPHWQDGFAVSLWEYVRAEDRQAGPAEAGVALARLHEAIRECPAELAELSGAREQISDGLDALERGSVIDGGTVSALRAVHAEVLAGLAGAGRSRSSCTATRMAAICWRPRVAAGSGSTWKRQTGDRSNGIWPCWRASRPTATGGAARLRRGGRDRRADGGTACAVPPGPRAGGRGLDAVHGSLVPGPVRGAGADVAGGPAGGQRRRRPPPSRPECMAVG